MAERLTAVDADRLARPFLHFLVAIAGTGTIFALLAVARAAAPETLVVVFAVLALVLVVGLGLALDRVGRRHGIRLDPDAALHRVRVQDLADLGIAATGLGSAAVLTWRRGLDASPDPVLALVLALVAVGLVALFRLTRVRLMVLPDAVVRAPDRGLANRYPLDRIAALQVRGPFLRVKMDAPLADWTARVPDAPAVAARIERLRRREEE